MLLYSGKNSLKRFSYINEIFLLFVSFVCLDDQRQPQPGSSVISLYFSGSVQLVLLNKLIGYAWLIVLQQVVSIEKSNDTYSQYVALFKWLIFFFRWVRLFFNSVTECTVINGFVFRIIMYRSTSWEVSLVYHYNWRFCFVKVCQKKISYIKLLSFVNGSLVFVQLNNEKEENWGFESFFPISWLSPICSCV